MNEYAMGDEEQIEHLRLTAGGGFFLPDLHEEFASLIRQLSDCVDLWSSYLTETRTTYYRWNHFHLRRRNEPTKADLLKNQEHLIELYRTVLRLQSKHQQAIDHVLDYYLERITQRERLSSFVPYIDNDQAEAIFVAISSMYYSTVQLAEAVLALGTTVHTVFELETTSTYRMF